MSDSQGHFADDKLLRFVRRLLPEEQGREVQDHVDRGCPECLRSVALWRRVHDLAGVEPEYDAPEGAVSFVKAAFALRLRVPLLCRLARAASLVFDSLREPLPEGIRARVAAPQHLLHETGGFLVDLRLETEGERQICLVGQVVSADGAERSCAGSLIVVVQGNDRLIAMTVANSLGEFHLTFRRRHNLTLYLDVPGSGAIMVPLAGSNGPTSASEGVARDVPLK